MPAGRHTEHLGAAGMRSEQLLLRQACLACAVLVGVPGLVGAQSGTDRDDRPFASAFSKIVETWTETNVPAPANVDGSMDAVTRLFSARAFAAPGHIAVANGLRLDRPAAQAGRRSDGTNWVLARPIDGFANGFDQFGNPAVGPVDLRGEARNFVRQKIVTEILSRTALGRGLSVLIDTGKVGPQEGRSRLLPFVSPKLNAREGKAAITLTWKF